MDGELAIELLQIEAKVLDPSAAELDIGVAEPLGDERSIAPGDLEHLVGHVDADDAPPWPDDLGGDEADLAGAAAEVEDRLAGLEVAARIATAVVPLQDLLWNHLEVPGVVVDRAAEVGHPLPGTLAVAVPNRAVYVCYGHRLQAPLRQLR